MGKIIAIKNNHCKVKAVVNSSGKVVGCENDYISNIYLRFEAWNSTTSAYESLPKDIVVQVVDFDTFSKNDSLAEEQIQGNGAVHFNLVDKRVSGEKNPDIFFLVRCEGILFHNSVVFPKNISTENIKSVTGKDGYYPDYAGKSLGSKKAPLLFRLKPLNIYLRFIIYNMSTHSYDPLPDGVNVDLMDNDKFILNPNDVLISGITSGGNGEVVFNVLDKSTLDESDPDIFFLVRTKGKIISGHTIDNDWSTKTWKTSNGAQSGFYEKFTGESLGRSGSPLEYRIGWDFHLRFEYFNNSTLIRSNDPLPDGIEVELQKSGFNKYYRTGHHPGLTSPGSHGFVDGVVFNVDGDDNITWKVLPNIKDDTIELPKSRVLEGSLLQLDIWGWDDAVVFSEDHSISGMSNLGNYSSPKLYQIGFISSSSGTVTAISGDLIRCVPIFCLKVLREVHSFFYFITNKQWKGIGDLTIDLNPFDNSYAWPVTEINIAERHWWSRNTIAHEYSHSVMWKAANYSSLGIASEAYGPGGDLDLYHSVDMISNSQHALIEGWAEIFEQLFSGNIISFLTHYTGLPLPPTFDTVYEFTTQTMSKFPFLYRMLDITTAKPLQLANSAPRNFGEKVEGAFALALFRIITRYIASAVIPATGAALRETRDGDLLSVNSWVATNSIVTLFSDIVWKALTTLSSKSNPTTTDFVHEVKSNSLADWHIILFEFHRSNISTDKPVINSISPPNGAHTGGSVVTITGDNFAVMNYVPKTATTPHVLTQPNVTIGGQNATSVTIVNHQQIQATIPASIPSGYKGSVDIAVETLAGLGLMKNGFNYI